MKKKLKIIIICVISVIVCYALYIGIEVYRFKKYPQCHPIIQIGATNVDITANSNHKKETYQGLGYTIKYEYIIERKENSDIQLEKGLSGEIRLFNKIILNAWVS